METIEALRKGDVLLHQRVRVALRLRYPENFEENARVAEGGAAKVIFEIDKVLKRIDKFNCRTKRHFP